GVAYRIRHRARKKAAAEVLELLRQRGPVRNRLLQGKVGHQDFGHVLAGSELDDGGGSIVVEAGPGVGWNMDAKTDPKTFFTKAPKFQPNAKRITGLVCGVRVEEVEDKVMRKIRYLDKLIDELAQGKAM